MGISEPFKTMNRPDRDAFWQLIYLSPKTERDEKMILEDYKLRFGIFSKQSIRHFDM